MSRRMIMTLLLSVSFVAGWIPGAGASQTPVPPTGRIAFASDRDWGTVPSTQIYSVNADGTGLTKVTNYPWWALTPSWSPDGTRIAFTGIRPEAAFTGGNHAHLQFHAHDIYVMGADGSQVKKIAGGPLSNTLPAWSPDGNTIAFLRCVDCGTTRQIALMKPDGSGVTEITSGAHFNWRPTWSPDGSKLAFERDSADFSSAAIYTVNRDGSGLTKLLDGLPCCPDPAWSPDGTRISFWNSELPGLQTLAIASGKVRTLAVAADLGGGQTFERWSSWSPDGAWLALGSCCETSDGVDLFLVSADGKTILPVPNAQAASGPAWQPAGTA